MGREIPGLYESPYSLHFNNLRWLGAWRVDEDNSKKVAWYAAYKATMTTIAAGSVYLLMRDLFAVLGNFKKMTWNLCVTTLFFGSFCKNLYIFRGSNILEKMRRDFHRDAESRVEPEDIEINKAAEGDLKHMRVSTYVGVIILIPVWLVSRYFSYLWGDREWPVPFDFPVGIDINDDRYYTLVFLVIGIASICGLFMVVETELAMFTLLIQILRELKILLRHIPKLNDLCGSPEDLQSTGRVPQEINPWLKEIKMKALVKQFSSRQQKIMQHTKDFEFCYNFCFLIQFFAATLLVVVSCLQCILEAGNISASLVYQMGYLTFVLLDMYIMCWFATKIYTYSLQVGEETYSTFWYNMPHDIQKDISMIIMRSQLPPKITSGKMLQMDLHAFTILVRNIYSWLALFLQLEFKTKKFLRDIIIRQEQLIKCIEDYEYIYNLSMFFHIFLGGFLLVMNGVETLIVALDFDMKMSYQIGYNITIIFDFLYHCLLATRITCKCRDIGVATYKAPWIEMDKDLRRDILLIILRSQKPPKLTSGRVMELNLHTFMLIMRNIYSWLALFRQIGFN